MIIKKRFWWAATAFFLAPADYVFAQSSGTQAIENSDSLRTYDVGREQTLVGLIVAYTAGSETPPFGPHLTLQTVSGPIDIHLGDIRTLVANHFTIQNGETLRIVGENIILANHTTQFLARILQKGTQVAVVRTTHGFPVASTPHRSATEPKEQAGVL
jgi:hypothetical protein